MDISEIKALDEAYYMGVFGERLPILPDHGDGATIYCADGSAYTDFLGGIAVNCLGYSDEGLVNAICEQAKKLIHISNYFYIEHQASAAEKLCSLSGCDKAFFANSGAEAIEGAMKLARKYYYDRGENRCEFITMKGSFHGRTLAALSATGQDRFHEPYMPLVPKYVYADYNDLASVEALISGKTCAVICEPIIGEGGVIPATPEFFRGLRSLCDERGILLIADEIQSGAGRTGKFLAQQNYGVKADITAMAKGIAGGVAIGALAARDDVAASFGPGDHGSTFGGNPIATAAADYVLGRLPEFFESNTSLGVYLKSALSGVAERHPDVCTEVRGTGLMVGLGLGEKVTAKTISKKLLSKGFLTGTAGGNTLRLVPPYVITEADIDALASALDSVL